MPGNDNIWFLPVESVLRTDPSWYTNLVTEVLVGEEMLLRGGSVSGLAEGRAIAVDTSVPGWIYEPHSAPVWNPHLYSESGVAANDLPSAIASFGDTNGTPFVTIDCLADGTIRARIGSATLSVKATNTTEWAAVTITWRDGTAMLLYLGDAGYKEDTVSISAADVAMLGQCLYGNRIGATAGRSAAPLRMVDEFVCRRNWMDFGTFVVCNAMGIDAGVGVSSLELSFDRADDLTASGNGEWRSAVDGVLGTVHRAWKCMKEEPGSAKFKTNVIASDTLPVIYRQNDPSAVGYNPNEEHAIVRAGEGGYVVWALRCDLNDAGTKKVSEPGLVFTFETTVDFELNLFGRPLAYDDSQFDSSWYATKIAAAGVWFENYNVRAAGYSGQESAFAATPNVYLVPIGTDQMRVPGSDGAEVAGFDVIDQTVPVPYPVTAAEIAEANWLPSYLQGEFGGVDAVTRIRRHPSFRAYYGPVGAMPTDAQLDAVRLVGRSVWNTKWMLVIPAGTLGSNREKALDAFVRGLDVNGDGHVDILPVSDIRIGFKTYSIGGK